MGNDDVYPDLVPEAASKPALAFVNAAFSQSRVLNGEATTKFSVWRLTLVAQSKTELQSMIDKLELIDNTRNANFSRIFTELIMKQSKEPDAPFRTAFVDLTVYN